MTEVIPLKDNLYRILTDDPELIGKIKHTNEGEEEILHLEEISGELRMIVDFSDEEVLSYIH